MKVNLADAIDFLRQDRNPDFIGSEGPLNLFE